MFNIIIQNENAWLRHGLSIVLREVLKPHVRDDMHVSYDLNIESAVQADVVVKTLSYGEAYLCHESFYQRSDSSLTIIYNENSLHKGFSFRLRCLENAVYIDRMTSVDSLKKLVSEHFKNINIKIPFSGFKDCQKCKKLSITGKQLEIAKRLHASYGVSTIAIDMDVNEKTVYSHKRNLMIKFGLKNTCELHHFLNVYNSRFGL